MSKTTASRTAGTPGTPAQEEKTSTYIVTSPVLHDAGTKRYEIDDEIELTDAQAAPLLGTAVKLKDAPEK